MHSIGFQELFLCVSEMLGGFEGAQVREYKGRHLGDRRLLDGVRQELACEEDF